MRNKDIENRVVEDIRDAENLVKSIMTEDYEAGQSVLNDIASKNRYADTLIERLSNKDNYLSEAANREKGAKELVAILKRKERASKLKQLTLRIGGITAAVMVVSLMIFNAYNKPVAVVAEVQKSVVPPPTAIDKPTLIINNNEKIDLSAMNTNHAGFDIENDSTINYQADKNVAVSFHELVVPAKHTYNITLPDGSKVMLNANSKLTYPSRFSEESREVKLEGEAYFEVSKSEAPFIVEINNSYVRVLGTEFNINGRKKDSVQTVLVNGSVEVGVSGGDISQVIKPNQMAVVTGDNVEIKEVDVNQYISWKSGYFVFIDSDFDTIIEELNEWYGVDIEYGEVDFENTVLTMSISKELSLIEMVTEMKKAIDISLTIKNGDAYEITREKQ